MKPFKISAFVKIFVLTVLCSSCDSIEANSEAVVIKAVDSLMKSHNIPAASFGVIKKGKIEITHTLGKIQFDEPLKANEENLFHIGSNTKSVTSWLAGRLVIKEKISWDTKFFDVLPELKSEALPQYHDMTLQDLLSHRTGITSFKNRNQWPTIENANQKYQPHTSKETRLAIIKQALLEKPKELDKENPYHYSNMGYICAALMLERTSGKTWEKLLEELNKDLSLDFKIGWPKYHGAIEPRGHMMATKDTTSTEKVFGLIPERLEKNELWQDYVFVCRPSGDLSVNIDGFLKFLDVIINAQFFDTIKDEAIANHILNNQMGWGKHYQFNSNYYDAAGSLVTFNSIASIIENEKMGVVVMVNSGDKEASKGMFKIKSLLEKHFLSEKPE